MRNKFTVGAISVLALFAIACGADAGTGSSSTGGGDGGAKADSTAKAAADTPKGPATVAAGAPLTLTEKVFGDATIVEITLANVKPNAKATDGFSKPKQGQFISVDISMLVKQGKYSINSTSFKFVTADNTAIDSTLVLDGKDLSANDVAAGQKASGTVWFDVPKGAEKGAKIAIKSVLADGDAGYWTL